MAFVVFVSALIAAGALLVVIARLNWLADERERARRKAESP